MKGNVHKKMTFEDREEKRWVKNQFGYHRYMKIHNRRLYRKKLKAQLRTLTQGREL